MTPEWERHAFEVMLEAVQVTFGLLHLPKIRFRHFHTNHGVKFERAVRTERERLQERLTKVNFSMHSLVEDLKDNGLSPMESIRLFSYVQQLFKEFEGIWMIKVYRTGNAARSFVRIILTSCILFYG